MQAEGEEGGHVRPKRRLKEVEKCRVVSTTGTTAPISAVGEQSDKYSNITVTMVLGYEDVEDVVEE